MDGAARHVMSRGHSGAVWGLDAGRTIAASAATDGQVIAWDLTTGAAAQRLSCRPHQGHRPRVWATGAQVGQGGEGGGRGDGAPAGRRDHGRCGRAGVPTSTSSAAKTSPYCCGCGPHCPAVLAAHRLAGAGVRGPAAELLVRRLPGAVGLAQQAARPGRARRRRGWWAPATPTVSLRAAVAAAKRTPCC
jgi:hypothetical protein